MSGTIKLRVRDVKTGELYAEIDAPMHIRSRSIDNVELTLAREVSYEHRAPTTVVTFTLVCDDGEYPLNFKSPSSVNGLEDTRQRVYDGAEFHVHTLTHAPCAASPVPNKFKAADDTWRGRLRLL